MSWEQSGDKLEKSNYVAFDLVRGKSILKCKNLEVTLNKLFSEQPPHQDSQARCRVINQVLLSNNDSKRSRSFST